MQTYQRPHFMASLERYRELCSLLVMAKKRFFFCYVTHARFSLPRPTTQCTVLIWAYLAIGERQKSTLRP